MVIVLKNQIASGKRKELIDWLRSKALDVHISEGQYHTVLGLVGDTGSIDTDMLEGLEIVEKVQRISEPFKKANRKFH